MRISFVVPQGTIVLGVVGPFTVFSWANRLLGHDRAYEMELIARNKDKQIVTSFGLKLLADQAIDDSITPIDTLIVAGPHDVSTVLMDRDLIAWVAKRAPSIKRFGAICTGTFVLAAAGLLDGKRATTHWEFHKILSEKFPEVKAESDRLFIRDGNVWTAGALTGGIDLALAMVEEDHGRQLAQTITRELFSTADRPESQPQSSARLIAQATGSTPIERVQMWIVDHIASDLSVKKLAEVAGMSVRNFTRVFQAQTSVTPARFVDTVRVDAARRMLESTRLPLKKIAIDCGFISITRMRRAFYRHVGVSPQEYRQKLLANEGEATSEAKPALRKG